MKSSAAPTFAAVLLLSSLAAAQGASSQAAAQELFDRGRKLMESGQYAEACPKLAASQKLDPGAGTLLNLAACYEKNGQTASAWVTYKDAAAASTASGKADWAKKATSKAAALEPNLLRLEIRVAADAPAGLEVQRDGAVISAAEIGLALPVDPGSHTVRATAPGRKEWSATVDVVKGSGSATVNVPALELVEAPLAAPIAPASKPPETHAPADVAPTNGRTQRIAGIAVASAGVVGVAIGAVFGLGAKSKQSDAKDHCRTDTICTQEGADLIDDAKTEATISTIAFGVGAAALAGGAVLYFTAPKAAPASASIRVAPTSASLTLGGAF